MDLQFLRALASIRGAAKAIAPEHQAKIINTLKATGIKVGLLIHFGNPKLETKRFTRHK